jgi:hypothetical protein
VSIQSAVPQHQRTYLDEKNFLADRQTQNSTPSRSDKHILPSTAVQPCPISERELRAWCKGHKKLERFMPGALHGRYSSHGSTYVPRERSWRSSDGGSPPMTRSSYTFTWAVVVAVCTRVLLGSQENVADLDLHLCIVNTLGMQTSLRHCMEGLPSDIFFLYVYRLASCC